MKTLTIRTDGVEAEVKTKQEGQPSYLKTFEVWQIPQETWIRTHFDRVYRKTEVCFFPDNHRLVALVTAEDLQGVFGLMNPTDDDSERFAKHVIPLREDWRSCSIGDVIVDSAGKAYYVGVRGFRELNY